MSQLHTTKIAEQPDIIMILSLLLCTDYRRPMKPFFIETQTYGLGQIHLGAFGVFLNNLSTPILVL